MPPYLVLQHARYTVFPAECIQLNLHCIFCHFMNLPSFLNKQFDIKIKETLYIIAFDVHRSVRLTFIGPCIVIYSYSTTNKTHLYLGLSNLVKRSTCFGWSFRPSSGAHNCTYGNRHMSNSCCYLLLRGRNRTLFHFVPVSSR